jgi:hypothetical protein
MPFTLSHAAAVLPLRNTRLPLAALMVGSMTPDFGYFLSIRLTRTSMHDLDGLFLVSWPVGFAVWLFYVHVLERPTREMLSPAWRQRLPASDRGFSPGALGLAALAVLIGAATHIAWDAFTHAHTVVTDAFPALYTELFELHGRPVRVYLLLQLLSSVFGLVALGVWAYNLRHAPAVMPPAHAMPGSLSDRSRLFAVLFVALTSGTTALLGFTGDPDMHIRQRIFHMLIGGMTGGFLAWCTVALLITRSARYAR